MSTFAHDCGYETSESPQPPIDRRDLHFLPPMVFTTSQAAKIDRACGEFVRLTPERLTEVCQELIELRKLFDMSGDEMLTTKESGDGEV